MMKAARFCGGVLLYLAIWAMAMPAWAGESQAQAIPMSDGLNVAILMDCSNSMARAKDDPSKRGADENFFRLDAASIMVDMCSIGNSNVAVLPFHKNVAKGDFWGRMIPVTMESRQELSDKILAYDNVSGGTYIFRALSQANDLLEAQVEVGNTNKNIILLLCDGKQSAAKGDTITDAQMAEELSKEVDRARNNGFVIYTIGLLGATDYAFDRASLESMALSTGGKKFEADSADRLPGIFSEIFADAIGSTMASVESGPAPGYDSLQAISMKIPNNSVREANILIRNTEAKNGRISIPKIIVLDPDQKPMALGENVMIQYTNYTTEGGDTYASRYTHAKIIAPSAGEWQILFPRDDAATSVAQPFDLLYNYNVQLYAQVADAEMNKGETLRVKAFFVEQYDPQTGAFTPSGDIALYQHGIQAKIEVVNAYGDVLKQADDVPMVRSERPLAEGDIAGCFYYHVSLTDLGITDSGAYKIQIAAEGDNLVRTLINPLSFTVANREPVANDPVSHTIQIEDILAGDIDASRSWTIDAAELFSDPDGDLLTYALPAKSELVDVTQADGKFTFATKGKTGTEAVTISATDNERESCQATVNITVDSIAERFLADHEVRLSFDKELYDKGDTVKVCLQLYDKAREAFVVDPAYYSLLQAGLVVKRESSRDIAQTAMALGSVTPTGQKDAMPALTAEYTLDTMADNYSFSAEAKLNGREVAVAAASILLDPVEPVLVEEALGRIPRMLRADGPEGGVPIAIDLSECFSDTPGDRLSYIVTVTSEPVARGLVAKLLGLVGVVTLEPHRVVETVHQDSQLTISPVADGKTRIKLTATDTDGKTASTDFVLTVESPKLQLTVLIATVLLSLILAAILFALWYWFIYRKAWPQKSDRELMFYVNDSQVVTGNGETEGRLPGKGKAEVRLSSLFDVDFRAQGDVDADLLDKLALILVRPAARNRLRVRVKDNRFFSGEACEVSLDTGITLDEKRRTIVWPALGQLNVSLHGSTVGIQRTNGAAADTGNGYYSSSDTDSAY